MKFTDPTTLQGIHASLVPLTMAHHDGLCEAVKDGELWKLWYTSIPAPEAMSKEIDRRLGLQRLGSMNPFCILDARGNPIGMTTYMNIDQENRSGTSSPFHIDHTITLMLLKIRGVCAICTVN